MSEVQNRVVTLKHEDLDWAFSGANPAYLISNGSYNTHVYVDPFPCYSHHAELTAEIAKRVEWAFPIGWKPTYYLLSNEETSRTNGHANRHQDYYNNGKCQSWIVLSGKRIPLHPAMTRYLVSHEYGHHVQWWIEYKQGIKDEHPLTRFERDYAQMRGIEPFEGYGGLKWSLNIGEVIANDFRICISGVESEFWPHPYTHPLELTHVRVFWEEMYEKYANEELLPKDAEALLKAKGEDD